MQAEARADRDGSAETAGGRTMTDSRRDEAQKGEATVADTPADSPVDPVEPVELDAEMPPSGTAELVEDGSKRGVGLVFDDRYLYHNPGLALIERRDRYPFPDP